MGYIVLRSDDRFKITLTNSFERLFLIKYGKQTRAYTLDMEKLHEIIEKFGTPVDVESIKEMSTGTNKKKVK